MPNRNGARGIHTAAMKGHVAVINSLIAKGECVDAVTNVSINLGTIVQFQAFFQCTYIMGGPSKLRYQKTPPGYSHDSPPVIFHYILHPAGAEIPHH